VRAERAPSQNARAHRKDGLSAAKLAAEEKRIKDAEAREAERIEELRQERKRAAAAPKSFNTIAGATQVADGGVRRRLRAPRCARRNTHTRSLPLSHTRTQAMSFMYDAPPGFEAMQDRESLERKLALRAQGQQVELTEAELALFKEREAHEAARQHAALASNPLGRVVRDVKCFRCGQMGHQQGDRECPKAREGRMEQATQMREDPLMAIMARKAPKQRNEDELSDEDKPKSAVVLKQSALRGGGSSSAQLFACFACACALEAVALHWVTPA
jgi:hypothetical protein